MDTDAYPDDDTKAMSTRERYLREIYREAPIDDLYVILGYLSEYFGGATWHEEVVESFYVNEFEKAKTFKLICKQYLVSQGLEDDVELFKGESGHSQVNSRQVCAKLAEQFEIDTQNYVSHRRYRLSKENDLFKTAKELYGDQEQMINFKRYSYLIGMMIRFKLDDKPAMNFANAGHKAQLAIDILHEFDAFEGDSFKVDYFFRIPRVTRITLSQENLIWAEIDRFKSQLGSLDA